MARVSTSDIRRFKDCRRLWDYASPLRKNYIPVRTPMYFSRGRAWHVGMEHLYATGADPADAFAREFKQAIREERRRGGDFTPEEVTKELRVGQAVLSMYPKWAEKADDFEVLAIEEKGAVPLTDEVDFSYRVDQVVQRRNGQHWVHDFKTTSQLPTNFSFLDFDEQITGYLAACEQVYDESFAGALFTYLLVREPTKPQVLKNGTLSMNKQIYSTPELYYETLLEIGEDPAPYKEFIQALATRCVWFVRVEAARAKRQKSSLWKSHQQVAELMTDPDVLIYPAPNRMKCSSCGYQAACLAESMGFDPEPTLQAEFVKGAPR